MGNSSSCGRGEVMKVQDAFSPACDGAEDVSRLGG
jgi:hypothetical protein